MERENHNKRGKRSSAIGGYGYITEKGYRRMWSIEEKRFRFEHVIIWETNFGRIPNGYQIHHKDRDKLNNDPNNLELVTPPYHKRIHAGCELRKDGWWKKCSMCKEWKHINDYYKRKDGVSGWCKKCSIDVAVKNKRKRKSQHS